MSEDQFFHWLSARANGIQELAARHPLLLDVLLGAVISTVSIVGLHTQHRLGPTSAGYCLILCLLLPLRRRSPLIALAVTAAVLLAQWLWGVPQLADVTLLVALYCIAQNSGMLALGLAAVTVEAGAVIAALKWAPADRLKIWVGLSGLMVAAMVSGVVVRQRRQLLASLRERAARLEVERDQEGRLAAAAERARIAREMHDIISHNVGVMIALADGASYAIDSAPEQVPPALEQVAGTGRQALAEMRRLLGVLTEESGREPLSPQPSLAQLDELVSRVEAAGIPISVSIDGDPHLLGEGVQLTVFRVVQEALTNTLKHAVEPSQAAVALRCGPGGALVLEVHDDGRPQSEAALPSRPVGAPSLSAGVPDRSAGGLKPGPGGGRGLPGMRERATAYGGQLTAGPVPGGGWQVVLRLPG